MVTKSRNVLQSVRLFAVKATTIKVSRAKKTAAFDCGFLCPETYIQAA